EEKIKMKKMKKFISLALAALLCTLLCACGGVQASPVEDFEYEFEDGEVTITGYIGSDLEIVIPETIDDRPVTVIGEEAFEDYDMTSISIPNSIISIQYDAFNGCSRLEKVTTYGTEKTILYEVDEELDDEALDEQRNEYSETYFIADAFSYCESLTSLEIPASVIRINSNFVDGLTNLTEIEVNGNNSYYLSEDGVLFDKDKQVLYRYPEGKTDTSYSIPDSVINIGSGAFDDCYNLTSIKISASVNYCSNFYGLTNLTQIEVDSNNPSYSSEDGILFNKDKTVLIRYPEGKTDASYSVPDSVTSIGDYAFYNSSLTSITIPDSVTSIETDAFFNSVSTIYGKSGSCAEEYAAFLHITFVAE
ncbi:MAG: leucine-rich repeat domain-containing protein, partial [Clostridiales bacterium]|nr:leucine-rich repeat domain-containing protein [Clostridiales bacterium]